MPYLGLDVGDERVGVAVSDDSLGLARPLTTLARRAGPAGFLRIADLVQEYGITLIVVGLPLLPEGGEGKQVASVRAYLRGLRAHLAIPCLEFDERDSTHRARELLGEPGRRRRRRERLEDAVAAAVILQDYIDRERGKA